MAEALYRKYRPQIFEDVVGQEHIERTIKNAIEQDKVSHAYLFTGPRGTGKTTTARLLAKALLCEKGPTAEPDGTCADCEMIAAGEHPDVYELDAASRTGVENVREEIIGRVQFAPTRGRYKIYIIDEVHMLSTAAFNALLKTLEEPPSHVVFILATTDPQKVPETIHSRCQRFDFRRISSESIVSRLGAICVAEGVEFEGEALDLIAHRAEGGMRNALTSLEQLIAFGEGKVTMAVAEGMLGSLDMSDLAEIVRYVGTRDVANCFRWTAEYVETGADLAQFTRDFAEHIRNMYVMSLAGADVALDVGETERRELAEELPLFGPDRLARLLSVLGDLSADLKTSTNPRLSFEIALTRMVRPDSDLTLAALAERVEALESGYSAVAHVMPAPMGAGAGVSALAGAGAGAGAMTDAGALAGAGMTAGGVPAGGAQVADGCPAGGATLPGVAADARMTQGAPMGTAPGAGAGAGAMTDAGAGAGAIAGVGTGAMTDAGAGAADVSRETFAEGSGVVGAAGSHGSAQGIDASGASLDASQASGGRLADGATPSGVQGAQPAAGAQGALAAGGVAASDPRTGVSRETSAGNATSAAGAGVAGVADAAGAVGAGAVGSTGAAGFAGGALPDALLQSLRNPAALQRMWQAVLATLKKGKAAYGVLFLNTKAVFDEAAGALVVEFPAENDFAFKTAQGAGVQEELGRAIAQACGQALPFMMAKAGARPIGAVAAQAAQVVQAAQTAQVAGAAQPSRGAQPSQLAQGAQVAQGIATTSGAKGGGASGSGGAVGAGAPAQPGSVPADPSPARGHHGIDAMTGASVQPGTAERGYGAAAYDEVPVDLYDEVPYDDYGYSGCCEASAPTPASASAAPSPTSAPAADFAGQPDVSRETSDRASGAATQPGASGAAAQAAMAASPAAGGVATGRVVDDVAPWEAAPTEGSGAAVPAAPTVPGAAVVASSASAPVAPEGGASGAAASPDGEPSQDDLDAMLAFGFGEGVGFTEV